MSATSSLSNMIYHKELKWINNYRSQKLFLKPHKSMNFYSGIFFFSISHLKDKSKLKYLSSKIKEKKKTTSFKKINIVLIIKMTINIYFIVI